MQQEGESNADIEENANESEKEKRVKGMNTVNGEEEKKKEERHCQRVNGRESK